MQKSQGAIERIAVKEYKMRRARVFEEMPPSSIALLPAGEEKYRNADTEYPFRQDSNFYYLTGFEEPHAWLVLTKDKKGTKAFHFFCRSVDKEAEVWVGKRLGQAGAIQELGADFAYLIEEFEVVIPRLLENKSHIFYTLGQHTKFDEKVINLVETVKKKIKQGLDVPNHWQDLQSIIHELRIIKSPPEITLMKKAADISAHGHRRLMQKVRSHQMEYELEAEFLHACYQKGARAMAYGCIVGGGENACTLHYTSNNHLLKDHQLVLVDAGCEYQSYASDITRTFPVNGRFTSDQKALYECVLKAQMAAIEMVKPGVLWDALQEKIVTLLVEGLVALGILKGSIDQLIAQRAYKDFYMHSSGHWLGLDVHDAGAYKIEGQSRPLKAGMVLTIEPGIYIAPTAANVDKRWLGMGIRIEDDILVTEKGYEVLSHQAPKTVDEIESLMKESAIGA